MTSNRPSTARTKPVGRSGVAGRRPDAPIAPLAAARQAEARIARPAAAQRAEARIARLAAAQHGLVTRQQLLEAGLTAGVVRHRLKTGRLVPVQQGVYRLGPLVSPYEREMAAVLACGHGATVSHVSAGVLHQILLARGGSLPLVDIATRGRNRCRRPGIRHHRVLELSPEEVTAVRGIPITTAARTLLDIAGVVGTGELERALARALRRNLTDMPELLALVTRYPRRPGVPALRALVEAASPKLTRSPAEDRFLTLVGTASLPTPETNVTVEGHEVDCLWRAERVIVEVDGFAYHSSPDAFETDRRRDAFLAARGYHVIRVTWQQIEREPTAVMVRLAQALARAGLR